MRQRKQDIPLLVHHFVAKFNKKTGKQITSVSKETLNALQILDRLEPLSKPVDQGLKALADLERDHILQVLQTTGWRVEGEKGAAVLLGLNPSTLRARMRKYGIRRQ